MTFGKIAALEGYVPAGEPCQFRDNCAFYNPQCPSPENIKPAKYPCWTARGWALISNGSDNLALRQLITKKRKIYPIKEEA